MAVRHLSSSSYFTLLPSSDIFVSACSLLLHDVKVITLTSLPIFLFLVLFDTCSNTVLMQSSMIAIESLAHPMLFRNLFSLNPVLINVSSCTDAATCPCF